MRSLKLSCLNHLDLTFLAYTHPHPHTHTQRILVISTVALVRRNWLVHGKDKEQTSEISLKKKKVGHVIVVQKIDTHDDSNVTASGQVNNCICSLWCNQIEYCNNILSQIQWSLCRTMKFLPILRSNPHCLIPQTRKLNLQTPVSSMHVSVMTPNWTMMCLCYRYSLVKVRCLSLSHTPQTLIPPHIHTNTHTTHTHTHTHTTHTHTNIHN